MNKKHKLIIASDLKVRSSVQKINLVANLIRGEDVLEAILQLSFCKKKASYVIKKVLSAAIANSQNNLKLDINNLYIGEIRIGKSLILKRSRVRARGKINRIYKSFSMIVIILKERKVKLYGTKSKFK